MLTLPDTSTLVTRFHEKYVKTSTCWMWCYSLDRDGYGQIGEGKYKKHKAHRLSYQIHVGPIPPKVCVLHRCDNPSCVNPDHLFLGTQQDNMKDKMSKNRQARGEVQGASKLSFSDVETIRIDPRPQRAIAADYGVSQSQISRIKTNRHWVPE